MLEAEAETTASARRTPPPPPPPTPEKKANWRARAWWWWTVFRARRRSKRTSKDRAGVGARAANVVHQAAAVLEEELAAGIEAAKRAEQRLVDVDELRSTNPDALMHKFRDDLHALVDVGVDALTVAASRLGAAARRAVAIRGEPGVDTGGVRTLAVADPVAPGASAHISMMVENDSDAETQPFRLTSSDLVSASGDRIDPGRVSFTPERIQLAPRSSQKVDLTLRVPSDASEGTYSAIIQATKLQHVRAILLVTVRPATTETRTGARE